MDISHGQVMRSLNMIESRLNAILDDSASEVLGRAKSVLRNSKADFDERTRQGRTELPIQPWGFSIDHARPLRFIPSEVGGLRLRVDLYVQSYWMEDPASIPCELNVVIRVWCLDENVCFRSEWDSDELIDRIKPHEGRVMLRLHFDLAPAKAVEPRYHLQVGGNARDDELHWFPKALDVPRLLHMPIDLVLASELIAATFYPSAYRLIRREPSWVGSLMDSQNHLLVDYFSDATEAIDRGESVLDALWNTKW